MKKTMQEVADRMEIDDLNDPRVMAEVGRLFTLTERRLVVLETHPNSGGCWFGKLGTETEIIQYLQQLAKDGNLEYVGGIVELKEGAPEECQKWLEFVECQPISVRIRPPADKLSPTPPLPGLEKRLADIEASAYGQRRSVWSILRLCPTRR